MKRALQKIVAWLNKFLKSCWMLPLGAAAVLLLGFLLNIACEMISSSLGDSPGWLVFFGVLGGLLFLLGVLGGLCVPLWLLVMTAWLLKKGQVKRTLCCWGASALAAVVAVVVGAGCLLQLLGGGPDLYARGLTVPEDKDFVLPRSMSFIENMEVSPRVQALRKLRPELPAIRRKAWGSAVAPIPELPNLEKLTRNAPELLHEYLLRALYAEAVNPRFNSPVLAADVAVYLAHENDPQTHALRAYLADVSIVTADGMVTEVDSPSARWKLPLHNGWYIAYTLNWYDRDRNPEENPNLADELLRLDDALAPLAQNPTSEQLDALLPPVPPQPFLCIWDANGGAYDMLIVIPAGYETGSFEVRAHEYTTGKPVRFYNRWRDEVKLGEVCRLICSRDSLIVYSGDWGEYYGSEWEIWFTPASGGEPRRVSCQPFLMMGWQH